MSNWASDELNAGDWVRHKINGSLGRVIEEGGELLIKPDSPNTQVRYPKKLFGEWGKDANARRIPIGRLAEVAQAADRALCSIHFELQKQPDWLSLKAEERKAWVEGTVELEHASRIALRDAVMGCLKELS